MGVSDFGNRLHSGEADLDIVGRRKWWYLFSAVVLIVLAVIGGVRGPNLGLDFTGGSQFQLSGVATTDDQPARGVVSEHETAGEAQVTVVGGDSLVVQTDQLGSDETVAMQQQLADAYGIPEENVTSSFIGPTWGESVTNQSIRAVVFFLIIVGVIMGFYFRHWKSALAAILAMIHDGLVTAGVYVALGFEITPAAVIGFLTIIAYSLYDTVVVFDKVRENTDGLALRSDRTFTEAVNDAVNQTLIRSINTSVVALLPVASILFIGAYVLGAGTLRDISLALFVGIIAGAYSSIFIAPTLLVDLRRRESDVRRHTASVEAARAAGSTAGSTTAGSTAAGTTDTDTADTDTAAVAAH